MINKVFKVSFDNFSVFSHTSPVYTEHFGVRIDAAINADGDNISLEEALRMSESGKVDFVILDGKTNLYVDKEEILSVFRETIVTDK